MKAALIIDLKGFAQLPIALAERMKAIKLSDEKVRSAIRKFTNDAIDHVSSVIPIVTDRQIGGDTWVIELRTPIEAVKWGTYFYKYVEQKVLRGGLFYMKPVMALAAGDLKFKGKRFMDNQSIDSFRGADKGEPFCFYAIGDAANIVSQMKGVISKPDMLGQLIDWQSRPTPLMPKLNTVQNSLADLLMDNEVLYFRTHQDVIDFLQTEQMQSKIIKVYGGPAPLRLGFYLKYARSIVQLLETTKVQCSVLNYLNEGSPQDAADWLLFCHLLRQKYSSKFTHSAYLLPAEAIKPVAYHVYDDTTVIMLRSFDEFNNTNSVSGSIVVVGEDIAMRFRDDFKESFRSLEHFDSQAYNLLMAHLTRRGADLKLAKKRATSAMELPRGKK